MDRPLMDPQPVLSGDGYNAVWVWRSHEWHAPHMLATMASNPGMLAECPHGVATHVLRTGRGWEWVVEDTSTPDRGEGAA